jgi:hypothetical protein
VITDLKVGLSAKSMISVATAAHVLVAPNLLLPRCSAWSGGGGSTDVVRHCDTRTFDPELPSAEFAA